MVLTLDVHVYDCGLDVVVCCAYSGVVGPVEIRVTCNKTCCWTRQQTGHVTARIRTTVSDDEVDYPGCGAGSVVR